MPGLAGRFEESSGDPESSPGQERCAKLVYLEFTTRTAEFAAEAGKWARRAWPRLWPPLLAVAGVVTVFWKLVLTKQYTFVASPDLANMIVPRLEAEVFAIRHWSMLLWSPYEWFGQPPIGQVEPSAVSPFTFLLALAPLHQGQLQFFYVHLWYVLIHCVAALFAYWFFRDLRCSAGPSVVGAILFATMGFYGNTEWPHHLTPAIFTPLVFLFLLRSLRGRAPLKSAAWAGAMLGISWLCGHHEPPVILSLAVAGVAAAPLVSRVHRRQTLLRMAVLFGVTALVSALQVLPAIEYGKLSKRWTATAALTWKDRVPFPEHEQFSVGPGELLHVVMPGGNGMFSDPFVGTVALSLAAIAILGAFRRREVRMFVAVALGGLLYAMARFCAPYGWLYALVPLVEKTREPMVALFLFQFAVAALAALGAETLFASPEPRRELKISKTLLWFGGVTFGLFMLMTYLRPAVNSSILEGDPRPGMIGLIALLLAGLYQAWSRGYLSRPWTLALLGLLLVIEQGNEVGWSWAHVRDQGRMSMVNGLFDTQDLANWLRTRPDRNRVEVNEKDIPFNFGDWYRMDVDHTYGASMLTATSELGGWWGDRIGRMYGLNYVASRTPTRGGLQEMITGKTGIKLWYNPEAFRRAWTVHQIVVAPNERNGADMMNNLPFDLRTTALTVRSKPMLDTCGGADRVGWIDEKPSSVRVDVEMACKGLLIVSDNWYPGWRAEVDGRAVGIWKVNTVIRGVVVNAGKHTVSMRYRPLSVYFGFALTLVGLTAAIVLHRRRETDGADTLGDAPKED
jgi:hypothetical protein